MITSSLLGLYKADTRNLPPVQLEASVLQNAKLIKHTYAVDVNNKLHGPKTNTLLSLSTQKLKLVMGNLINTGTFNQYH